MSDLTIYLSCPDTYDKKPSSPWSKLHVPPQTHEVKPFLAFLRQQLGVSENYGFKLSTSSLTDTNKSPLQDPALKPITTVAEFQQLFETLEWADSGVTLVVELKLKDTPSTTAAPAPKFQAPSVATAKPVVTAPAYVPTTTATTTKPIVETSYTQSATATSVAPQSYASMNRFNQTAPVGATTSPTSTSEPAVKSVSEKLAMFGNQASWSRPVTTNTSTPIKTQPTTQAQPVSTTSQPPLPSPPVTVATAVSHPPLLTPPPSIAPIMTPESALSRLQAAAAQLNSMAALTSSIQPFALSKPKQHKCLYDFVATLPGQVSMSKGDLIEVYEQESLGWWKIKNPAGEVGMAPTNRIEQTEFQPAATTTAAPVTITAPVKSASTVVDDDLPPPPSGFTDPFLPPPPSSSSTDPFATASSATAPSGSTFLATFKPSSARLALLNVDNSYSAMLQICQTQIALYEQEVRSGLLKPQTIEFETATNQLLVYLFHASLAENSLGHFNEAINYTKQFMTKYETLSPVLQSEAQNRNMNLQLLHNMGLAYEKLNDLPNAIQSLTSAASLVILSSNLTPDTVSSSTFDCRSAIYSALGNLHTTKRDYDLALDWHQRAIESEDARQPPAARAWIIYHSAASCFAQKGEYEQAIQYDTRAIELQQQQLAAASSSSSTASATKSLNPRVFFNRGLCYQKLSQFPSASADFTRVIELDATNYPKAYVFRAKHSLRDQKWSEVIQDCQATLKLTPEDVQAREYLTFAQQQLTK